MFYHDKHLQYNAMPERSDPVYAKKLQEVLGGQYGEISVMMQYLFQGWNCRVPAKYGMDEINSIGDGSSITTASTPASKLNDENGHSKMK